VAVSKDRLKGPFRGALSKGRREGRLFGAVSSGRLFGTVSRGRLKAPSRTAVSKGDLRAPFRIGILSVGAVSSGPSRGAGDRSGDRFGFALQPASRACRIRAFWPSIRVSGRAGTYRRVGPMHHSASTI